MQREALQKALLKEVGEEPKEVAEQNHHDPWLPAFGVEQRPKALWLEKESAEALPKAPPKALLRGLPRAVPRDLQRVSAGA